MQQYIIRLKRPSSRTTVWAGPERSTDVLNVPESDRLRAQREALANRLEALVGKDKVVWNRTAYAYFAELSEEQVKDVATWNLVRSVVPSKKGAKPLK